MKNKKDQIKKLKEKIKDLKSDLDYANKELSAVTIDRDLYRTAFIGKLKWFIELLGKNTNPCLKWTIEDMSKTLNKAQKYYW